jgi:hypothetical protein
MASPDDDQIFESDDGLELSQVPDGYVAVFELCREGIAIPEVVRYLQEAYGLPAPPEDMVRECIDLLVTEELIRPCPRSAPAA